VDICDNAKIARLCVIFTSLEDTKAASMTSEGLDFAPSRFSTSPLPDRDRLPFWREVFGQQVVRCDIESRSNDEFEAEAVIRAIPGLRSISFASAAVHLERNENMVRDGDDAVVLMFPRKGKLHVSQRGREVILRPGDATLVLHEEPGTLSHANIRFQGLIVPRAAIGSLVTNVEDLAMRPIPHSSEALRLLAAYVKLIHSEAGIEPPTLCKLIATHIQDLIAMCAGATRDGAALAGERGMAAARLATVKADIIEHIGHEELTVEAVAKRQGTTPRTIQRLFEREGSTFSAFKQEQQLVRASRMLSAQRYADWTIASIAFAVGFGDLSYFHRVFVRRFGKTPSEMRFGQD
jgi:AraC-like DNA-binding protein